MTNLLVGADLTTFDTAVGWFNATAGTNFTSTWSSVEGGVMRWDVTTGGANIAQASHGAGATNKIACTPGQVLTCAIDVKQTVGATFRTIVLEANYYQADQVTVSAVSALISTSVGTASGAWQRLSNAFTTPSDAAFMRMRVRVNTPALNDVFLWDNAAVDDGLLAGLAMPTGFTVTQISTSQLNLSWNAVSGATGYDIERDGVVIVTNQAGTTYSDTGRAASTTYGYRVRARG